ncbi:MAG: class I SAM-dependent methyltransferase [Thiogranum sp.]|nr:class I SAM-dependent methyltransferase [Thiogranum sp.]
MRQAVRDRSVEYGRRIVQVLLWHYRGPVAIRLWNGETVIGSHDSPCTLVIQNARALRDLVLYRDLVRLAETHLSGAIDVEGDVETLFSLTEFLSNNDWSYKQQLCALWYALRLPAERLDDVFRDARAARSARRNSRESIAHHYDVSNDFYRLWLDPEMVYSCGYFRDEGQSLAEAQRGKLDYICRKLRLQPGHHLLDIGCGWGALAIWAARHYGVTARGITLSEQQFLYARERVNAEGLEERVKVELRDYRDLDDNRSYDRIVSIGMFEHVGVENFPLYFGRIKSLLKPSGLFLNHGITNASGWQRTPITRFINRYIFPDGELARISDVNHAMENAGFELLDVESLRRHYALTLRHWVQRLETQRDAAILASSETTYRLWRLYMAGSAHYFQQGSINIYQVLAGHANETPSVPLTRDDLYRDR